MKMKYLVYFLKICIRNTVKIHKKGYKNVAFMEKKTNLSTFENVISLLLDVQLTLQDQSQ